MYKAWLYYGEFIALGIWGIVLTLARRILFGELCKDAALGSGGKGKMLRAMTLKFEKSYEVKVGIYDIPVFVQKYLCQERKFGIRLGRWRRLPERWTSLILGVGFVESVVLWYLERDAAWCVNRFLAAATAATNVRVAVLWFETDSLWERAQVCLLDYVSNTLYPRQVHTYEDFKDTEQALAQAEAEPLQRAEGDGESKGVFLKKEEEQIFNEVLTDFLGSST